MDDQVRRFIIMGYLISEIKLLITTLFMQVAGYVTKYDANDFTFITVKGSGHMVSTVMDPTMIV